MIYLDCMATVVGPLLSLEARGKLANILTFRSHPGHINVGRFWKPGSRRKFEPSVDQLFNRHLYGQAVEEWRGLTTSHRQLYKDFAEGEPYTGFNFFIKQFIESVFILPPPYPTNGLLRFYSFDSETVSGTTLEDLSGNGNHGTLVSSPAFVPGNIGEAIRFSTANERVEIPPIFSGFTFSYVFSFRTTFVSTIEENNLLNRNNAMFSASRIFSGGAHFERITFQPVDGGRIRMKWRNSANTGDVRVTSANHYNDGNWHRLIGTVTGGSQFRLYIDGELVGSNLSSTLHSGANPLDFIGTLRLGVDSYRGDIDEFLAYNRVLTAPEIASLSIL